MVKEFKFTLPFSESERKRYTSASPAHKNVTQQLHFYLIGLHLRRFKFLFINEFEIDYSNINIVDKNDLKSQNVLI